MFGSVLVIRWSTVLGLALGALGCAKGGKNLELEQPVETWPDTSEPAPAQATSGLRDAAVVVGIEDYSVVDDIPGSQANAADWYRHLSKTVGIPTGKVYLLRNHEATKEKILEY